MIPEAVEPLSTDNRATSVAAGTATAEAGLSDALRTLRKRKWIVLLAVVIGFAYGWYKSSTQVRRYEASGVIEIGTGAASAFRGGSGASAVAEVNMSISTEVEILHSNNLLLTVARDLDLANNASFWGAAGPMPHMSLDQPSVRQSVIGTLNGDLTITPIVKTNLIRISCSTLNPQLSADIVNKLVAEYIHRSFQSRYEATQRASDFLTVQLNDLKQRVEEEQVQLIDLGKRIGNVGLDAQTNQISNSLNQLASAVGSAEIRRIGAQSRYRILSNMDPNALDPSIDATGGLGGSQSPIAAMRATLESAESQYASLAANLGPNHPQVRSQAALIDQMRRAISLEESRLLTQAKQDLTAAQTDEATTRDALDAEKSNAYRMRDDLIEYGFRKAEYESTRALYDSLRDKLRSAGISAGMESTEIDIVDSATAPISATLEPRSTIVMVNTVVMLLVGLVLAFVVDALDSGIQTMAEVESLTGLPSLALVPRLRRTSAETAALSPHERAIAVVGSPKAQFSEAFRALRTSLLLSTPGGEPQVILMTSSTPSEGKTTTAMNLAAVLAQRGVRVLLVDADLRRPAVHHRLGMDGKVGLASVLAGSVALEDAVQSLSELPQLDVLVSGPIPPFPTEMLGSNVMHTLLQKARGIYTHIVLDSPPLLSVTDSVILSHEVDTVLLVVRHGKSSKHAVRRGRELLARAGAPLTGIVFNAVDSNSPEYYAYYGYTGYTSYGSPAADGSTWDSRSKSDSRKENQ